MTTKRTAYTFAALRYSHDVVTGEFLNLGIVVYSNDSRKCVVRMAESFMRLTLAFPGVNTIDVKKELDRIAVALKAASNRYGSLAEILRGTLPDKDGSFHWSEIGAGVCVDLSEATRELFDRFVAYGQASYGDFEDLFSGVGFAVRADRQAQWISLPACNDADDAYDGSTMVSVGGTRQ